MLSSRMSLIAATYLSYDDFKSDEQNDDCLHNRRGKKQRIFGRMTYTNPHNEAPTIAHSRRATDMIFQG